MFIPDPTFFHPGSEFFQPGSVSKNLSILPKIEFLSSRKYDPGCSSRIRIPHQDPDFLLIPDPGFKKAPDPGSGSATLTYTYTFTIYRAISSPSHSLSVSHCIFRLFVFLAPLPTLETVRDGEGGVDPTVAVHHA
jgi:hypothetical protein